MSGLDVVGLNVSVVPAGPMRSVNLRRWSKARDVKPPLTAISLETTPFFYAHQNALGMIQARRWASGYFCPRCHSVGIRKVNTCKVAEAYNCADCHYNFNSLSGTFFHGAKIGLNLQLQVMAIVELCYSQLSLRQIADFAGVSYKTAKAQFARLEMQFSTGGYLVVGEGGLMLPDRFDDPIGFLQQPAIRMDLAKFEERLDGWLGLK